MAEIVALEKERQIAGLGESVGEAVAHVKACAVTRPAPVAGIGVDTQVCLVGSQSNDFKFQGLDEILHDRQSFRAIASHDDSSAFHIGRGANKFGLSVAQSLSDL